MRYPSSLCLALFLCVSVTLAAAEESTRQNQQDSQEPLIAKRIIEADLPLREVQNFTEIRVPSLPTVRTAEEWEAHAKRLRQAVLDEVVFQGEAARWRDAASRVEWLGELKGGSTYRIKKLRFEAVPGLWIPALLYEPLKLEGKVPCVLNVNGHDGNGKVAEYKQARCINQAKRGMLALNVEWLNMGQLRGSGYDHYKMNQLNLCGTSGLAPFYLSMKRSLDVLLAHPHADPDRLAVAGLSGGGWQTIFISALDTRVKLANPVAGYSGFRTRARYLSDLGDSEQTPCDLATIADYTHLTALLAPRPALLTYNAKDNCCFAAPHALPPLLEAARPIYRLYAKESYLHSHVNEDPGTHNFKQENREVLYKVLGEHFFTGAAEYSSEEIPYAAELKSKEELNVPLPEGNASFHSLALELCKKLPKHPALPKEKEATEKWRKETRAALSLVVRELPYEVAAESVAKESAEGTQVTLWKLRIGEDWTLPAVEMARGAPKGAVLLIADGGRATARKEVSRLLEAGQRVLAVDPFYLGESKISKRDFLFALLVSAVGERPLGIQASQLGAVARWLSDARKAGPVKIVARGPRTSLMALVAAGLEDRAIGALELQDSMGSLKEVIEQGKSASQTPELLCFGLLELLDIRQLVALVAPRPVRFERASERVRTELAGLGEWYKLHGVDFNPLD